ncbi:MAG: DUF370 domain-containing protein [Clostridia bacterium]|nr:DUF370 domain-containing protein [Clostridia bacterium]
MFLHLGSNVCADKGDIIGIFDLDNVTVSAQTRNYLNALERDGKLITVSAELPKSLVVTSKGTYISPISVRTLIKRAGRPY